MEIHFLDVGCGNMTLLKFVNGHTYLYDCNVTSNNSTDVLSYLTQAMGQRTKIDTFICSHRDADHMRGIQYVHRCFPVGQIRDAGVPGTTTDTDEYKAYMALRRRLAGPVIRSKTLRMVGDAKLSFMNAARSDTDDVNDQSIVVKVDYQGSSALLAADTGFLPWKMGIVASYDSELKSNVLLAAHHGSLTFFDDPGDKYYYTEHIEAINPAMTLISVGPNPHGLPDPKAVELYEEYSTGSDNGNKIHRTDQKGNMKLTLKGSGSWNLVTGC